MCRHKATGINTDFKDLNMDEIPWIIDKLARQADRIADHFKGNLLIAAKRQLVAYLADKLFEEVEALDELISDEVEERSWVPEPFMPEALIRNVGLPTLHFVSTSITSEMAIFENDTNRVVLRLTESPSLPVLSTFEGSGWRLNGLDISAIKSDMPSRATISYPYSTKLDYLYFYSIEYYTRRNS